MVNSYYESHSLAEDALIAEREYYKSIGRNYSLPPQDRAAAIAVAANINSKLLVLQAQFDSYMNKYHTTPPSNTILERAAELSQKLAKDLNRALKGDAILKIINTFFGKWTVLL